MNIDARWIGELPDPLLRTAMLWAYQTMLYAMSKRAADLRVDIMAQQRAVGEEALHILREMYERAQAEADNPGETDEMTTLIARQVVDWAVDHVSA